MRRYVVFLLTLLIMTACNNVNEDEAISEKQEEGLLQTGNNRVKTNDDLLLEAREEVNYDNDRDPLHPTQAEELVKEKLGVRRDKNTIVQYDHVEDGNYIVHVYSLEGNREKSEAWYMVDLQTRTVETLVR
ncbi:hypothetical protein [Metabacillus halosaccharovorans]|uniref:PepSY domain-containing protein n=1 Tax=Metabacillus halosaccharovorans TaxID=930124 RepID=A0ABT3DKI4_9BACI|nr:hypothetical protein [Metabacillus halosaccharovorans]MCV9887424.1 hypothetical protein [Metabacillus halosaccharovorans]